MSANKTAFTAGDVVYDEHGQGFEYVARVAEGHIAMPVYEQDEYEPYYTGDPRMLRAVFAQPPVGVLDDETAKAEKRLKDLRSQIDQAREELTDATRQRSEALKVLSQHPDLLPVVEWLEGRITHVASVRPYSLGITIQPIADAVLPTSESDRRCGEVRLLALYGGYTGPDSKSGYNEDFRWQLNAYRDGSGDHTLCFLGTSEEHAKERLQVWLDTRLKRTAEYGTVKLARSAMALSMRVPESLAEKVRAEDAANEERARQYQAAELAKAEARAAEIRARLGAPKATGGEA